MPIVSHYSQPSQQISFLQSINPSPDTQVQQERTSKSGFPTYWEDEDHDPFVVDEAGFPYTMEHGGKPKLGLMQGKAFK